MWRHPGAIGQMSDLKKKKSHFQSFFCPMKAPGLSSSLAREFFPHRCESALLYCPILLLLGVMVHVGQEESKDLRRKAQAQQLLLPAWGSDPFPSSSGFCPFPALIGAGHERATPLHLWILAEHRTPGEMPLGSDLENC